MLDKAQIAYNEFLASQKALSYDFASMTKEQQDIEMLKYTTLKLAAGQEQTKNETFLKERQAAFAALEEKYKSERDALSKEWQEKENTMV